MSTTPAALAPYATRFRADLLDSVIPFWLRHSLDREHGGYFTGLDRDGTVYDTRKYVWLQGRAIWMFSRLYNQLEPRPEFLDAAKLGVGFLRSYARDEQGRFFFSLTREGRPYFFQRKPYGAVFAMLGLLEYGKAARDEACIAEAEAIFWRVLEWIAAPSLLGRPTLPGQLLASNLANQLVVGMMLLDLADRLAEPRYRQVLSDTIAGIARHFDQERGIYLENVAPDGQPMLDEPEGRLFNPGHSIETAWIQLHLLRFAPDAALQAQALTAIERSLELGWDAQYGGLLYLLDVLGRPTLQIEATMKLWWPHAEALYALVLAYSLTGEARWLSWLEQVDAYTYARFADPGYGEWFGYLDRQGQPALTSKGGSYKGFYHVPRALLYSVQCIESL